MLCSQPMRKWGSIGDVFHWDSVGDVFSLVIEEKCILTNYLSSSDFLFWDGSYRWDVPSVPDPSPLLKKPGRLYVLTNKHWWAYDSFLILAWYHTSPSVK